MDPDGKEAVLYEGEVLAWGCCGFGSHALKYRQLRAHDATSPRSDGERRLGMVGQLGCSPVTGAEGSHHGIAEHDVVGVRRVGKDAERMPQLMGSGERHALVDPGRGRINRGST